MNLRGLSDAQDELLFAATAQSKVYGEVYVRTRMQRRAMTESEGVGEAGRRAEMEARVGIEPA